MICWLAGNGVMERGKTMPPCEGRIILAHLIPQQLMRRELATWGAERACKDPRSYVPACGGITGVGGHHGAFDVARTLRVPFERLPAAMLEFADELGLRWWVEKHYKHRRTL